MGTSCASTCTVDGNCQTGFFCDQMKCKAKRSPGMACTAAGQCASSFCADGVCCMTACGLPCYACNLVSSPGTCGPEPAGTDSRNDCPAELASTCGRAGGCNGSGGCSLHAAATTCVAAVCSGTTETAPRTCNGLGVCGVPASRDCTPFACGQAGACVTRCTLTAECAAGFTCGADGACGVNAGLVLHYTLDETMTSTVAADSSGNGFNGTFVGGANSVVVPVTSFPDVASRQLMRASRDAVLFANMPAALKPANNVTVSAWYRATSVEGAGNGSEVVSAGDQYALRVRSAGLEFAKHTSGGFEQCRVDLGNQLDGLWHHLAGVTTPQGMLLYFDGVQRCNNNVGGNITYDQGRDLLVGRHGNGSGNYDFEGNIDEVRIYTRALSAAEILWLARGGN
jgi:hypothetical protein